MARLRKVIVLVGLLFMVALVPVQAGAAAALEPTSGSQPAFALWHTTVQWVAEWITAWTSSGEPTDPDGALPLAPDGSGGDQATTSTDPDGENGPGIDPNG